MYCEGSIDSDNRPLFRCFGECEDPKVQIYEEPLKFLELKSILKLLIVKDVLPPFVPIRNIRTFENLCKYFLFPFLLITNEQKTPSHQEEGGSQSNFTPTPGSPQYQDADIQAGITRRGVELWGRAPGLFASERNIYFLKNVCNICLHYIHERYFRVAIISLDG